MFCLIVSSGLDNLIAIGNFPRDKGSRCSISLILSERIDSGEPIWLDLSPNANTNHSEIQRPTLHHVAPNKQPKLCIDF